jgi:hypothetical protein
MHPHLAISRHVEKHANRLITIDATSRNELDAMTTTTTASRKPLQRLPLLNGGWWC